MKPTAETVDGYCDSCQFGPIHTTLVDAYARTPGHGPFTPDDEKAWGYLCDVCRMTHAGTAFLFPRHFEGSTIEVLQQIAHGTNTLLEAIERNRQ